MSPTRRRLALAVIGFIFLASTFDILTAREHWPFSPYMMYSRIRNEPVFSRYRLYGVPEAQPTTEFPIVQTTQQYPLDNSRFHKAIWKVLGEPDAETRFQNILQNAGMRYELWRVEGKHKGPELSGLRLYEVFWDFDPTASNVDSPIRKSQLSEWFQKGAHG
jgi:hypothetical protein